MTKINTEDPIGDLTLNYDHQAIVEQKNKNEIQSQNLSKREKSLRSRELALNSEYKSLQRKINRHENDARKQNNTLNKIAEKLNERSRSLNRRTEKLCKREKRLEAKEAFVKQNSLAISVIVDKLTEIDNKIEAIKPLTNNKN